MSAPAPEKVGWIAEWDYAHRGLHGADVVENSASAFRAAIERGLGIECDIQRSLDDWPMVFHDWNLQRLVGRVDKTEALTAAQLQSLRFFGQVEGPITLANLLEIVGGLVPLLIEIKSRRGYDVERTCALVSNALEAYRGKHAVMSFDPRASRWFAQNSPDTVRGLVVTEESARGWQGRVRRHMAFRLARPDFLAYDIRDLPSPFAAKWRARGVPVATWTVRTPEQRARAASYADAPIAEGEGLERAA